VLAIRYDWRNNSVLFVHNLSSIPTEVTIDANAKIDGQLVQSPVGRSLHSPIPPAAIAYYSNPSATAGSASAASITS
jgi:hypothetical protein